MNIVFIIGNGFDLSLGLKTSYKEFYKYYISTNSSLDTVNKLKSRISENHENWSDLELSLGKDTKSFSSAQDFIDVCDDIVDKLSEFLDEQTNKFESQDNFRKVLFESLSAPERYLTNTQKVQVGEFRDRWKNHAISVNVISFNYTEIFEKIIVDDCPIKIGALKGPDVTLQDITHVHGYTHKHLIMGVNDASQIANKQFQGEQEILETFVKESRNQAIEHRNELTCREKIATANLICIFGSSIGDTDSLWWEAIGKRLLADSILLIFNKQKPIPPRREHLLQSIKRSTTKSFLSKTTLSDEDKKKVSPKIYVGVNTEIFGFNKA